MLTCMLNYTNMKLYKFYQERAVKIQVFVESARNPHLEGSNKGKPGFF